MKTLVDMLQSMKGSKENTFKFNSNIKKDNQILSKRSHSPDPESNKRKNSVQYILNQAHKRKNDDEDTKQHKITNIGQHIFNKATKRLIPDEEIIDNTKKVRVDEIIDNLSRENPEVLNIQMDVPLLS